MIPSTSIAAAKYPAAFGFSLISSANTLKATPGLDKTTVSNTVGYSPVIFFV